LCLWPGQPEGRDRRGNEPGIESCQRVIAKAEAIEIARGVAFYEEVCGFDQLKETLSPAINLDIQNDALFVGVECPPRETPLRMRRVFIEWDLKSSLGPTGRLNGNHLCSQMSKDLSAVRGAARRQLKHPVVIQHDTSPSPPMYHRERVLSTSPASAHERGQIPGKGLAQEF